MNRALHRQRQRRQDGFSLLEVIIALGVLLFGIIAVMQLFPTSMLQAKMAAERTISAELANSVIGQIRAAGAVYLTYQTSGGPSFGQIQRIYSVYEISRADNIYHSTSFMTTNGGADSSLQRVTVTVILDGDRRESFVTYVARQ